MKSLLHWLALPVCLLAWGAAGANGGEATTRPHVVLLVGAPEYRVEITMRDIAQDLQYRHGLRTTLLVSDSPTSLPGLAALTDADLAVFYLSYRKLPAEQMQPIREYVASKRPIVALRSSVRAFSNWREFAPRVLGVRGWQYDWGPRSSTDVRVLPEAAGHPILEGVAPEFHVRSPLYHVLPLAPDATPLLLGRSIGPTNRRDRFDNPVAWTRTRQGGGKVFYTSLGHHEDFGEPSFYRLLINAIHWALGRPAPQRR